MKHILATACLVASAALVTIAADTATDKEPLKLELPKAMFVGTPVPIAVPNLEPAAKGPRPDMLVPKGTTNLSKGKKVTASDSEPLLGELDLITDGDKSAEEGCFVELAAGKQWVQIDLGAAAEIYAIALWHYHLQARVYHDVVIQVSDDPDFVKDVKTVFNNDSDNSAGLGVGKNMAYVETNEGKLVDAGGVKGRYVRLYTNGNTSNKLNHYIEVEVYGKAAK